MAHLSSIHALANRYRVERVAFDVARTSFNAYDNDPALEAALHAAAATCQASAQELAQLSPSTAGEREDQLTVAFDAAVLAGEPMAALRRFLERAGE